MSMNEQEIKYLTESEVNKVTGGAGKFKKSSTSIALASALLAGSMMPTQSAGVPESRAVVSDSISNKNQGKSNQGFYEKATGIINKIFNDADVRNVLVPVLAAVGVPVLGAGSIYLTSRIVKRISEAKTPGEILKSKAKEINDNAVVSKKTGISKEMLDDVEKMVNDSSEGDLRDYNLTNDVLLVVCKDMEITTESLGIPLKKILQASPEKKLYLVLQNCNVLLTDLLDIEVHVLDLRGTTCFRNGLKYTDSVDKVLLSAQPTNNQHLWLWKCKKLGPIYQLTENKNTMDKSRLFLPECHLGENFKLVNLNHRCDQLMNINCLLACTCPRAARNKILDSFAEHSKADDGALKGV